MNTVSKGDAFEEKSHQLIESAIQKGELGILPSAAKLFKKKGYFSQKRGENIIFDLTIEVWLPNAETYAYLWIIECKSYSSRVPVNDVEEFESKIRQVAGLNVKGVLITDSTFQSGAFSVARANGMMLIETNAEGYNIVLQRIDRRISLLPDVNTPRNERSFEIDITGKMQLFFLNLFVPDNEKVYGLQHLTPVRIQELANNLLIEYEPAELQKCMPLDLDRFMDFLSKKFGLQLNTSTSLGLDVNFNRILGNIDLEEKVIYIEPNIVDTPRFAFVLAHEIGHFILHSNLKINQQTYQNFEDSSFDTSIGRYRLVNPKQWIEWQANVFASMLLMPENSIRVRLISYQMHIGINHNRGFIFRDNQPVNRRDYATYCYVFSALFWRKQKLNNLSS
ncbi:ImmA/IrrE family metallo-endopeptidase [Hymenobacter negativus]|uniref:ImmA/IrrE family metallo-endopeptidase n=1 Tax=Hymenobacter negativus TaxID=2795026 RepID=A0ABS0Q319_9BACT|nr:ImmA/IrrE family metallo-endopeptidase [Hymenobacter negativus]MBH8557024.1 ImmA/IrrE family metallo-endopeptidase [Hymenobacter negativus]